MIVGELLVLVGANNAPLTAALASSEAQMKGFAATSTSTMAIVRTAALGVGIAAVAGMGLGIKAAGDFQEQMATVNTIARLTPEALAGVGREIRGLSVASGAALPDLTAGFYDLLSVGVPVGQAMEFLRNSVTLSIGGLSTANEAVLAITTGINAWSIATGKAHLTMKDSALVMDVFAKSIETGGLKASDIAPALANVASSAAALNIPIQEVGATWAVMTTRGFSAATAATAMDSALIALQKRPPGMKLLEEATHKSYLEIAKTQGAQVAMQAIVTDANRMGVSLNRVFGRQEGADFARNVAGSVAAADQYKNALADMYDSTGTAAGQAAERMGTFNRGTDTLGESIGTLGIAIGTGLLPQATSFIHTAAQAVQAAAAWADANPDVVATVLPMTAAIAGLVVAATSLGAILRVVGTAVGILTSPILLVVAAVAALAAHFGLLGDDAKNVVDGIGSRINALVPATGPLRVVFDAIGSVIAAIPGVIATAQSAVAGFVDSASALAAAFGPGVIAGAQQAFAALGSAITTVVGAITAFVTSASNQRAALTLVGQAADGVRAAIGWVSNAVGVVIGWFSTFVTHLTGAENGARGAGVTFGGVASAIGSIATTIATVVTIVATFVASAIDAANKIGVFKVAGDAINTTFGLIGDAIRIVWDLIGLVATALSTTLTTAFNTFKTVIDVLMVPINALADALRTIITLAGQAVDAVGKIPGVSQAGNAVDLASKAGANPGGAILGAAGSALGGLGDLIFRGGAPEFAGGGIVPGVGPQLIVAHGGETVTAAGQSSGPIQLTAHFHVEIGGEKIGEWIERRLFNDASVFSSGFSGSPVTVR